MQLEAISWAVRELYGAAKTGGAALDYCASVIEKLLAGGALSASGASVADVAVAAAFPVTSAVSPAVADFAAKVHASAAFTAAKKAIASPDASASPSSAAGKPAKDKAAKGEKGEKPAAESGAGAAAAAGGKAKGGKAASGVSAEALAAVTGLTSSAPISPSDEGIMTTSVLHALTDVFTAAMHSAFPTAKGLGVEKADIVLNAVPSMLHHYQCNIALSLFPKLKGPGEPKVKAAKGKEGEAAAPAPAPPPAPAAGAAAGPASPRAVADALIAAVTASGPHPWIGKLEASGPGYINIYLPFNLITARLAATLTQGVKARPAPSLGPRRVLVDYSSPNIAKDMHIGHLRSTIIGDGIARMLEFAGHTVTRVNHVGDWGTQFGMLIAYLKELVASGAVKDEELDASIADLTGFYKASKKRFDGDEAFKERAHQEVVALQAGDATNLALWKRMVAVSSRMFGEVYTRLGVDARLALKGESFYNPLLPGLLEELGGKGLLKDEAGPGGKGSALVQWVPGFEVPLMVRKSDGGFGYDSTDLAALKYRLFEEKADWVIYVVDAGQSLHFDLVFRGGQAAGWYDPAKVRVEHVGFGVVLGEDGKKFKTRDGSTVRLTDVLDEAKARARSIIEDRLATGSTPLSPAEVDHAASVLGYGGVKYFDLRQNRVSDYAFSYDRMLSPDGDTSVYLEYAHARVASILRKAKDNGIDVEGLLSSLAGMDPAALSKAFTLTHVSETLLAAELLRFQEVLTTFQLDLMPHRICEYTYFLCGRFTDFFRDCPVLAEGTSQESKEARLRLCAATKATLATCMKLLGIEPLERI